jgi:hypothetical protein
MRAIPTPKSMAIVLALLPLRIAEASPKILSLVPPTEHTCLAFRIELPEGQALSGLRWHHNDSTLPFPRLLFMEAQAEGSPDLSQTGLILKDLSGDELGWGEAILSQAVTSTTGYVHAVFVFPPHLPTTGVGDGSGPGLGVEFDGSGPTFEVSPDGLQWIRYQPQVRLVVEPVFAGSAKMQAKSLAELAERVDYEIPGKATEQKEEASGITRNALHAARPNPFNPRTQIRYDLSQAQTVSLRIYDLRGRLVTTMAEGVQPAGRHELVWQGSDATGTPVASGVYFLRLELGDERFEQRLTLVR